MVFDKVKELIVEKLEVEPEKITMETNILKDLEADSLDAVEVILALEEEYGVEIPDEEADNLMTVGDLVKYIEDHK